MLWQGSRPSSQEGFSCPQEHLADYSEYAYLAVDRGRDTYVRMLEDVVGVCSGVEERLGIVAQPTS